jgi:transcriptional regulator with XRE-family HTH domain
VTFAERLKELRDRVGLTQAGLHRASGLSLSVIYDYEQGKREPSLRSAFRLADALGVDVNVFKDCDGPAPKPAAARPGRPPTTTKPARGRRGKRGGSAAEQSEERDSRGRGASGEEGT